MDFDRIDMDGFLYGAILTRFQDVPPYDFDDFIGHLFLDNGYIIQQSAYSDDFGADLIVEKGEIRTAIQIKRYDPNHKAGVKDINQIIGARSYYQCDAAMLITTSDFTASALKLSESADVIPWNWDRLFQAISDTYMNRLSYDEYFKDLPDIKEASTDLLTLKLSAIEYEQTTEFGNDSTIIYGEIQNESNQSITVFLDLPTYLTRNKKQLSAIGWVKDGFVSGMVYPGASVEFGCIFSQRQIGEHHNKDTLILRVHSSNDIRSGILKAKMNQLREGCFLVTYAFGRDSEEYRHMVIFRDTVLLPTRAGKWAVSKYYYGSVFLLNWLPRNSLTTHMIRMIISPAIRLAQKLVNRNRS